MSLEELEFEMEVKDLAFFLYFITEIGFKLAKSSVSHLPDGSIEIIYDLYFMDIKAGKIKTRFVDTFYPESRRLYNLRKEFPKADFKEVNLTWVKEGYWAIPLKPIYVTLYGDFVELIKIFEEYEDEYPTNMADELLAKISKMGFSY
ncbi:MAG: hypothetical protein J7L38_04325 [Thermoproteales archaeon]|nr:hypothetical protein [Thermoproteales archaeon]